MDIIRKDGLCISLAEKGVEIDKCVLMEERVRVFDIRGLGSAQDLALQLKVIVNIDSDWLKICELRYVL